MSCYVIPFSVREMGMSWLGVNRLIKSCLRINMHISCTLGASYGEKVPTIVGFI